MTQHSAHDISKLVILWLDTKGDYISNKKLQKLLYYIEAWALVHQKSVIKEDFEAWIHGPVIPSVYREYREFRYNPIQISYTCGESSKKLFSDLIDNLAFSDKRKKLFESVMTNYGSLSAFELELLSHSEPPWLEARKGLAENDIGTNKISKESMQEYYHSLL
jgi:uncharacterized phage-associated protein